MNINAVKMKIALVPTLIFQVPTGAWGWGFEASPPKHIGFKSQADAVLAAHRMIGAATLDAERRDQARATPPV